MAVPMGFFTDTTVCIGCKACEVACHQWNLLPATNGGRTTLSGESYDNTRRLDGINWRHVKFIEQFPGRGTTIGSPFRGNAGQGAIGSAVMASTASPESGRWLLMSDVCKHCVQAGCLEVCPTGAIVRTEFDTVVIQSDVCNGCRDCIAACPFGVIGVNPVNNVAQKCTLCYDRMLNGLTPACAKACPTASIQFGTIADLKSRAIARVQGLRSQGVDAYLYGADEKMLGGLNSFYLLVDRPEVYGLPADPKLPTRNLWPSSGLSAAGAVGVGLLGLIAFRLRRMGYIEGEED